MYLAAVPDLRVTIEEMVAEGDRSGSAGPTRAPIGVVAGRPSHRGGDACGLMAWRSRFLLVERRLPQRSIGSAWAEVASREASASSRIHCWGRAPALPSWDRAPSPPE